MEGKKSLVLEFAHIYWNGRESFFNLLLNATTTYSINYVREPH